jgi:hypothetical protein
MFSTNFATETNTRLQQAPDHSGTTRLDVANFLFIYFIFLLN